MNSSETSAKWTVEDCVLAFDLREAQVALHDHILVRNQGALENWMREVLRCNPLKELPHHEITNKLFDWGARLSRETGSLSL